VLFLGSRFRGDDGWELAYKTRSMSQFVLTLIAPADATDASVPIAAALQRAGATVAATEWLAPGSACDIFFDGIAPEAAERAARNAITGGFDLVAQPVVGRRKKLLVADLESTIIENEMLDEMADLIGQRDRVAAITARAMNGESDFAAALKERVALFKNQPESLLAEAAARLRVTPGAARLVKTMTAHGAATVLISGGFGVFTRPVRDRLGFSRDYANELLVEHDRLTGAVREPVFDGAGKLAALRRSAAEFGVTLAETLAVGDGANDVAMLQAAGLGIAYRAKPQVREQIRARIDHADLNALLYVQGYRAAEILP
jgi:phosphoserine phosphatase